MKHDSYYNIDSNEVLHLIKLIRKQKKWAKLRRWGAWKGCGDRNRVESQLRRSGQVSGENKYFSWMRMGPDNELQAGKRAGGFPECS